MPKFRVTFSSEEIVEAESAEAAKALYAYSDGKTPDGESVILNAQDITNVYQLPPPSSIYVDVVVAVPVLKLVKVTLDRSIEDFRGEAIAMVQEGMGEVVDEGSVSKPFDEPYTYSVTDNEV